jgi:hypothetical protein
LAHDPFRQTARRLAHHPLRSRSIAFLHIGYCIWQAFCLAKPALIGYTAYEVGSRKLCHSFGYPDSAGIGASGGAE